jgi:hypothetical protein
MKTIPHSLVLILLVITFSACSGNRGNKGNVSENDTVSMAPDTGFTGIKKFAKDGRVVREVTFKNGVRNGMTKTFYPGGQVYQTFWYENDLKEDSAKWFYSDGKLFRSTPFSKDTIEGIQKQYYKNGRVKAKIGYSKGMRTPFFEEYTQEGKLFKNYPDIVVNVKDEYNTTGLYRISLELSDKSQKVEFYRGEFINDRFDTTRVNLLKTVNGKASLTLKKTGKPTQDHIGIIAAHLTPFLNRRLFYKEIKLPYNDLK